MKKAILFAVLFVAVLASVAAILQSGWTSTTVPSVARTALGVPGLTNNNVFTGSNSISGSFTGNLSGATGFNSSNLVGTVWGGISNSASGGTNLVINNTSTMLANSGATLFVGTNVGVGNASPIAAFHLTFSNSALLTSFPNQFVIENTDSTASNAALVKFLFRDSNSVTFGGGFVGAFCSDRTPGATAAGLSLATRVAGNLVESIRIEPNGNTGIGSTNAGEKLEVGGNVKIRTGVLQVGNAAATTYNRIGTGTATIGNIGSADDLHIQGDIEIGGNFYPIGAVSIANGSTAMPALSFLNQSGTGLYYAPDGSHAGIGLAAGGVLRVSVNGSPGIALDVFGDSNIRTNIAPFDVTISNFVIGTRYTNSNRRAFVAASFQLAAAVAGTAAVTMNVEQSGTTNKLTVSSGPLAGLTTIEPLTLLVGPGAFYYFTDTSSGAGAVASIVAGTSSKTEF